MLGGWDRTPAMGGATPSGIDGALVKDDIPDERGDTLDGIPDGTNDAPDNRDVGPNEYGGEPSVAPDNPLAEVNVMPGQDNLAVKGNATEDGSNPVGAELVRYVELLDEAVAE